MRITNVFTKNIKALNDKKTLIVNYGGSRSSKTYSIIQLFTLIATNKSNTYLIIVASSVPKLKKTVVRDLIEILADSFDYKNFNKQELRYSFDNGSVIQFMNADIPENFTGVKSDYVLLDEVNTYRYGKEIFMQLENRNEVAMFPTFNPTAKFWIVDLFDYDTTEVIHSTYKDNPFLPEKIITTLENRAKTDINFYKVYTLGEWGSLEGLIFKQNENYTIIDNYPLNSEFTYYGLDFGMKHELVITQVDINGYDLYCKELAVVNELDYNELKQLIKTTVPQGTIYADQNEQRTVLTLQRDGINITFAKKGKDSVMFGISKLKSYNIKILRDSIRIIKDFQNYSWLIDTEGNSLSIPDKKKYDPDAIDSLRYAISYIGGTWQIE